MDFSGDVWRYIPAGCNPTDVQAISEADGRWNRPETYGCVYTALTKRGALAEYLKSFNSRPSYYRLSQHALVHLRVKAENVANLTHWKVREKYMIDEETMRTEPEPYETCRRVADHAFLIEDNQGLKVPSAAHEQETNLVVYPDIKNASAWEIIEITDPDTRSEINETLLREHFEESWIPDQI